MRALVFRGPGSIELEDLPAPRPEAPTDAVVRIEAAGLCGSDLHPYTGREGARSGVIAGHEGVGHVVATGDAVSSFEEGDRVIVPFTTSCGSCPQCETGLSSRCPSGDLFGWGDPENEDRPPLHGMQTEQVRVPLADSTLVAIPDSMAVETALLLSDNLPTGWYAALRAEAHSGPERLAVLGSGSVGVCAAVAANHLGAGPITIVEPVEERRSILSGIPYIQVFHPDDGGLSRSGPFPSIIDAAGTAMSQGLAFELAAAGATISMIAVQTEESFGFSPIGLYDRNLTIRSGRAPVRSLLEDILPLIAEGQLLDPSERVFTHQRLPLSSGPEIYRMFAERNEQEGSSRRGLIPPGEASKAVEDGIAERHPGVERPCPKRPIGESHTSETGNGVDPEKASGPPEVTVCERRIPTPGPVRVLVVPDLETESPRVRLERANPRHDTSKLRKVRSNCIVSRGLRNQCRAHDLSTEHEQVVDGRVDGMRRRSS